MATQSELPAGKCHVMIEEYRMRFYVDRSSGKPIKLIVPLLFSVGPSGRTVKHADFMTVDPDDKTPKGTARATFTVANLRTLGIEDPATYLADALDVGAEYVEFPVPATRSWVPCEVKYNGQYINVEYGEGIRVDQGQAKRAGDAFRKLGKGAEPVNPFAAPPPGRGTPVAPPPPPPAEDTSFGFGHNEGDANAHA